MDTIEAALLLVASHYAALVLLSDSYASDERKGVRQKHFQQSKMEHRKAMRFRPLSLISLPAQEFAWVSRMRERISHFRGGTLAARRSAHASAVSAQSAGGPGSGLDWAC